MEKRILSTADGFIRTYELNKTRMQILKNNDSFVAMFHDVVFCETRADRYAVTIKEFNQFIDYFTEQQYQFLSMADYCSSNAKRNRCVLTFDDGFVSTYELMKQVLEPRQIPFHINVVSEWIGKKGYVNQEMLLEMKQNNLCTIGAHSCSHPMFRFLDDQTAMQEIVISKEILENYLGESVDEFAFPYGSRYACSKRDFRFARQAGFQFIYSTEPKRLVSSINYEQKVIPRINATEFLAYIRR